MGVIIISIILSSLESTAGGQGSVSKPGNYWIGVNRTAPSCQLPPSCLLEKGTLSSRCFTATLWKMSEVKINLQYLWCKW